MLKYNAKRDIQRLYFYLWSIPLKYNLHTAVWFQITNYYYKPLQKIE